MSIFYVNGTYTEESAASLAVHDLGILRGYGVFDFLRTYGGHPFRLDKNIARLRNSCAIVELNCPWSDDELSAIIMETLRRNQGTAEDFDIRIVVTGGQSSSSIFPDGTSSLFVMVKPTKIIPPEWYRDGVKVITTDLNRLFPNAKTTMYTQAILAQKRAREVGGVEALYRDEQGNILEGTTSSLFMVKGGELITPGTQDGTILPGITRMTVLELAEKHYTVQLRSIPYAELIQADEVFITAANKQIVPVVAVDEHQIGDGKPGKMTQHIFSLFCSLTQRRAAGEVIS